MLTNTEKGQLKRMLQDPGWAVIQRVAEMTMANIQDDFVVTDNEWDTIKGAIGRESRIKGIRDLIQDLYKKANE